MVLLKDCVLRIEHDIIMLTEYLVYTWTSTTGLDQTDSSMTVSIISNDWSICKHFFLRNVLYLMEIDQHISKIKSFIKKSSDYDYGIWQYKALFV